ncbi:MAG: ATP-dependent DNA helicase RecG [Patescibacteria group bacterium]|nr:ATP-dependent DNA helicase RecG [Patescibacteria group bacterium]
MELIQFNTPVEELYSVGKTVAQRLKNLGLKHAKDILYHFPSRYEDFSNITTIDKLTSGIRVTIKGKIDAIQNRRSFRRRLYITEAIVSDQTGSVKIIWFNQPYLAKTFVPGDKIVVSGKLEMDKYGLHFTSPSYEKLSGPQIHTGRLVPVYPTTSRLTQRQLRFLTQLSKPLARRTVDYLPYQLKKEVDLLELPLALQEIHFPRNEAWLKKAVERLKFDELFPIQIYTLQNRRLLEHTPAPAIPFNQEKTKRFVEALPFKLTNAQRRSAWEILKDMEQRRPMNRLLEGDVGSGKTVVVSLAILNAADRGWQSVMLAPTEILAQQHFETFTKLFQKQKITVCLLTRTQKWISRPNQAVTKTTLNHKIANGNAQLVIGTHAILQEHVVFKNLGLAIVDEQHRFGVDQRKQLTNKSRAHSELSPHFLSLTATPIPRTLALGFYGDLDISIIDELPKGRQKIATKIVLPHERKATYDFISEEIQSGRQVFVICPLIDPSDKLGVKSVKEEYERLSTKIFPEFKIGLLHGRLRPESREKVMREFLANRVQLLVSTSVVEVGIDIPNATVMLIEAAERFGLAQLHQFRGRVGRGLYQSYCFLLTETESEAGRNRLQAVLTSQNGFELAEKDLEMRGPGELYGLKQSGFPEFRIARLTDFPIIKKAQTLAKNILEQDFELSKYPLIRQKMKEFKDSIHWE